MFQCLLFQVDVAVIENCVWTGPCLDISMTWNPIDLHPGGRRLWGRISAMLQDQVKLSPISKAFPGQIQNQPKALGFGSAEALMLAPRVCVPLLQLLGYQ